MTNREANRGPVCASSSDLLLRDRRAENALIASSAIVMMTTSPPFTRADGSTLGSIVHASTASTALIHHGASTRLSAHEFFRRRIAHSCKTYFAEKQSPAADLAFN
jgi:hypothetical protein